MRLWSVHPKYLDCKGIVAAWREGLLAKRVLSGKTRGYKNHPQLRRFYESKTPLGFINSYLFEIFKESENRRYSFDKGKLEPKPIEGKIPVTLDQIRYEFGLLKEKARKRDSGWHDKIAGIKQPEPNPIFKIVPGPVENWEKVK